MKRPLHVIASGMMSAVGFDAKASRAAIRAGLSPFEESEFLDDRGRPVLVARLPLGNVWGPRRLGTMVASAVGECLADSRPFDPSSTALLLIVAERDRRGHNPASTATCMEACEAVAGGPFHPASRALPLGRAGIGEALAEAGDLLESARVTRVVVAGVDSYLTAQGINHLLRRRRLLSVGSSDGFIPGEGAGALLVALDPAHGPSPSITILGAGMADDASTLDNDAPQLARGLTAAARAALSASGHQGNDMAFRMADLSGESFYFRDAALTNTRLLDHPTGHMPLLHITDSVGETGAAVGPLTLAYMAGAMPRGHLPGKLALTHFASDGGARAALVVAAP